MNGEWGVGNREWGKSLESETLGLPDFPNPLDGFYLPNYSSDSTLGFGNPTPNSPLFPHFPFPIPHSPFPIPSQVGELTEEPSNGYSCSYLVFQNSEMINTQYTGCLARRTGASPEPTRSLCQNTFSSPEE